MACTARLPVQRMNTPVFHTQGDACWQALTQFHILLLSARSLHLVGRVSGRGVQEVLLSSLGGAFAQPSAPVPSLALLRDAETSTIYLAAGLPTRD